MCKGLNIFSFVKRVKQVNGHFETVEKKRGNRFEHLFVSSAKGVKTTGLDDDHR